MRPNRSWTFKKFQKADLTGAIDMIVEDGIAAPQDRAREARGHRARQRQLGVLNTHGPGQSPTR
jgi:hypothetical protein